MTAYYNEMDPYAAQWLRNLIAAGHIAPGVVDERSIADVRSDEIAGFVQCHFFAGIGIWSHALRRAGWSDDRPVWTGSCPCQPFSAAGKQAGFADERHLWPVWHKLVQECRPPIVLGEQVASALDWLDLVSADMEASGYAFGAADLCAAGFDGAHIRQRLYWMAHTTDIRQQRHQVFCGSEPAEKVERRMLEPSGTRQSMRLADADDTGPQGWGGVPERADERATGEGSLAGRVANADRPHAPLLGRDAADWLFCRDGKWRPVESGTFPLVDAAPARVGRLRAYGNGLDAETATQFAAAVMECLP